MIETDKARRSTGADGYTDMLGGEDRVRRANKPEGGPQRMLARWFGVAVVFAGSFSVLAALPEPAQQGATNTIGDQLDESSVVATERQTNTMADQLAASGVGQASNGGTNTMHDQMADGGRRDSSAGTNTMAEQLAE